jgi:hypothetical protein
VQFPLVHQQVTEWTEGEFYPETSGQRRSLIPIIAILAVLSDARKVPNRRPQRELNRGRSLYYLNHFNNRHQLKVRLRGEPIMNNIEEITRICAQLCEASGTKKAVLE